LAGSRKIAGSDHKFRAKPCLPRGALGFRIKSQAFF
jgi:hypothetical protein